MKKKYYLIVFITLIGLNLCAQNLNDISVINKSNNLSKLNSLNRKLIREEYLKKEKALEYATKKKMKPLFFDENGDIFEIIDVTPDGHPLYLSTQNRDAARSTRTNHLNTGGSLNLGLNGSGMVARVWDGGKVRATHNLLAGKITVVDDPDGTTFNDHSTHVTGTMVANNSVAATKGMAYEATARTFNWTNDESEVISEIQGGMLISNHSYGVPMINSQNGQQLPGWYIGAYTSDAANWDEIIRYSPYYLMVAAAGNNGNDFNTEAITNGFDKLTGNKTAKNSLVVANAQDATVNTAGNLTTALTINSSSSQGPTDDRRIKPDITGNGTGVSSCVSTSDSATGALSGTSMASPNVSGTLLLLQEYHKKLTNNFMRGATLKGLATHTADDAGVVGPDPIFGWGLLNAKVAAQTLTNNGLTSWVSEEILNPNQTSTFTFKADNDNATPLIASITWMDLPGQSQTDVNHPVNDNTTVLVNDLDLRITNGVNTFYPWSLPRTGSAGASAVRNTDNFVDNIENIKIDAPVNGGNYTITITHKGNLQDGPQPFSLIVTGISSNFSITSTSSDQTVCAAETASYDFNYVQNGTFTTNFSIVGLPTGAIASLDKTSLNTNGTVKINFTNLNNVLPGVYTIGITGNNGTETETRYRTLTVYKNDFQPVNIIQPANSSISLPSAINLEWIDQGFNVENYKVEVSKTSDFSSIVIQKNSVEPKLFIAGLESNTKYYWRVIPSNRCGTAILKVGNANKTTLAVPVYNFSTGVFDCGKTYSATDFTNASIAETANAIASVPVIVSGGHTISGMKVNLNITHSFTQDMTIYLEGPSSIGSPKVNLFVEACTEYDDIIAIVSDTGGALPCNTTSPSINGEVLSAEPLANFNGLIADGTWILHVSDPYNGDGGIINSASIEFCNLQETLGLQANEISSLLIYPNPTQNELNISFDENINNANIEIIDIQGRNILNKELNSNIEKLNLNNLQRGVYIVKIENNGKKSIRRVILK